jgi:RNase P subunit RPR2
VETKEEETSRRDMDQEALEHKSKTILSDIREWRRVHPKATFVEIEDEIHKRMMQLEAQVIQEATQESQAREWGRGSEQEAPHCPNCAIPLYARGKHQRRLQGNGGQSVTLKRMYGTCPKCGQSFFPSR